MKIVPRLAAPFVAALTFATSSSSASAAPPAPRGAHPRIWLTAPTMTAIRASAPVAGSAAARAVAKCQRAIDQPSETAQAGSQGYAWAYAVASCGLSWQISHDPAHGTMGVTLLRAMLDDYTTLGDGAGGDAVVQHDTGYAMRFFGAYAALGYDWLYDAPGVDDTLRAHARARFEAWTDWYDQSGYLNTIAGANYHAGYVSAKTMIAIAEAGEGPKGDAYWADVVDRLFGAHIVGKGLAAGGPMVGGDWVEGWQYGPMAVMEYALAARAVEEQGASVPAMHGWASDLVTRFLYAMTPTADGLYAAGDLDDPRFDAPLTPRTLIAALAGPASDEAAGWAKQLKSTVATDADLCPAFDALAEARAVTATDFHAAARPTAYLAPGARNLYARSGWDAAARWAVFSSAPRMVPDHQHADASTFVFYRGGDRLVVDPSPYGSRSSLTANAITVDSNLVPSSYRPSQSPYARGELAFARATASGVAAARGEIAQAFDASDTTSDVALARRDWVFLPEGEVVAIDRVRTDDAARNGYVRFRTPATLALGGDGASGVVGGSRLAIHAVARSGGGAPTVRHVAVDDCWTSSDYGACAGTRTPVDEYALTLPGPSAWAVHVLDGLGATDAPADTSAIADPSDDGAVIGARIVRGGVTTYVVAAASTNGATTPTLAYGVPGDAEARHVVFDAPADAAGHATVTATAVNGRCRVAIAPGGTMDARPIVVHVGTAAGGCAISEDAAAPVASGGGDAGSAGAGSAGAGSGGAASAGDGEGASRTAAFAPFGPSHATTGGGGAALIDLGDTAAGCTATPRDRSGDAHGVPVALVPFAAVVTGAALRRRRARRAAAR